MNLERTDARFQTTRWTLVEALRAGPGEKRDAALSALTERYWPAVYGYLRRSGLKREQAGEATQDFFVNVVLTRGLFERADPAVGRLRSLVMAALRNHMTSLHRRASARRARDVIPLEAFECEEARLASSNGESPEHAFDRAWAAGVLAEALRRCEAHYAENGKHAHWELFEARVFRPAVGGPAAESLSDSSERLGFRTPADAAAAVQTVKRRVNALMREVVSETVDQEEDAEDELAALRAALGHG